MTEATTCEACGSPVTQNEHGETWHIARPMTVAEAAKVLLADADALATITRGIQAQYAGRVLISQSGVSDGLRSLSQGGE